VPEPRGRTPTHGTPPDALPSSANRDTGPYQVAGIPVVPIPVVAAVETALATADRTIVVTPLVMPLMLDRAADRQRTERIAVHRPGDPWTSRRA
jgi:hypothetical protein